MHHPSSRILFLFMIFLGMLLAEPVTAQRTRTTRPQDTIPLPDSVLMKLHSPRKATIYSAVLPGLGQIYNRKYWKLPILYAGFAVMGYFIYFNTDYYLTYKSAYIESSYGNLNGNYADLVNKYDASELLSATEYYRRNLEISILITTVWYILNIVDAAVDAHLYTYNVTENLSLAITPDLLPPAQTFRIQPGIKLSLRF